jgi:pimeloyl-ACP methyl ester carboxylesterase
MKKLTQAAAIAILGAVSLQAPARAETPEAVRFRSIFVEETKADLPNADARRKSQVVFLPDGAIENALRASSMEQAMQAIRGDNLANLFQASAGVSFVDAAVPSFEGRNLTIVLVPGMFAEFIKNRAFEDVLEKPSAESTAFSKLVAAEKAKHNPNAVDSVEDVHLFIPGADAASEENPIDLDKVINVADFDTHGAHVKVILLHTPFASLESLGSVKETAPVFNRRLEKYLALTGKQEMAFVGYSRGTPVGLEMLAEAKAENKAWVKDVKAMISLSGVSFGSALADDATANPNNPTKQLLDGVTQTANSLELFPDGADFVTKTRIFNANSAKWVKFGVSAGRIASGMFKGGSMANTISMLQVNPQAPLGIFLQMWKELGLNKPLGDYNANIHRFQHFLDALNTTTSELSSASRATWWQKHEVPKNVTYYAMTAAMSDPGANAVEKDFYASPLGYGGGSYDDVMLIQNRKDYETVSGVALNDSQVSVVQEAFIPGVIGSWNSANKGLKTKYLGVCNTHHWGMALRQVNKMLMGQVNGFPRAALLRSLAIQVLIDNN